MLLTSIDDHGVARIVIDRPDRHNAFDEALIAALTDNFTTLGHEYEITVIALNADKQSLSKGSLKAPFSGKFVILQGVIGSP